VKDTKQQHSIYRRGGDDFRHGGRRWNCSNHDFVEEMKRSLSTVMVPRKTACDDRDLTMKVVVLIF